ncbi:glycine dehydrogenase [Coprinopsis marcescibilis]|uniref:Glycine cleavage system H protein n=1 Tax=Coprinopsis marcescibilis TaxID=230819 RepID=A0A5C3LCD2_COPMA|nr:glycine dehydrogenase [Coprinopsis marcescibilis]
MQSILRTAVLARPARAFCMRTPAFRPVSFRTLVTKRYSADHESVIFDDTTGLATVTITNYAQSSLGDVVFVELPSPGTEVAQGDAIGAVESVKAASDIYAPVSGTIEEINEILSSEPGLLNKSPEEKGWLCKIKLSEPAELEQLLTEEAYKAHCES